MTWCPLKAKPVTRAFREVQRCPNEPLKAAKRAAPQSERGTKKTRLRAKFLAQNCYAPTNKRQQKMLSFFVGLSSPRLRGHFFGLVLCRNKYKRAMTARFRNVAKGNISRLRDAQAFHAAVKRPPYFTFARQRRHFTAGHSLPGLSSPCLRGLIWAWFYAETSISAIEKRFRNVAEGNISRLREAQTFHRRAQRVRLVLTLLARSILGLSSKWGR